MKFLIDAQSPPGLAQLLVDAGHLAHHVSHVGSLEASDDAVWTFARQAGAVIVTKDEDFAARWLRAIAVRR